MQRTQRDAEENAGDRRPERTGRRDGRSRGTRRRPAASRGRRDDGPDAGRDGHPARGLQRRVGNQGVQRLVEEGAIQPKLAVGSPDSRFEREADRVAEAVVGSPEPTAADREAPVADREAPVADREPARSQGSRRSATPESTAPRSTARDRSKGRIRRTCARCARRYEAGKPLNCEECESELRRAPAAERDRSAVESDRSAAEPDRSATGSRTASSSAGAVGAETKGRLRSIRGGGRPMRSSVRSYFEPRFGASFDGVRVHTGRRADEAARAVNARAFTLGRNVVFRAGEYRPGTAGGKRLLAHELTHVLQQGGGPGAGAVRRKPDDAVTYSGGPTGTLAVFRGGSKLYSTSAISGHKGSKSHQKSYGPIPNGTYGLHPQVEQKTVTKPEGGTCGADPIWMGYQQITATQEQPCGSPNHYCTEPCPQSPHDCFTPQSCWGSERIRIEGKQSVSTPGGGSVTRGGFYIHGGHHSVTVTSGCIKVTDGAAFDNIRKLKGEVSMCVGPNCAKRAGGN